MSWIKYTAVTFGILMLGPLLTVISGKVELGRDWRSANRAATGVAPDPATTTAAVVQVYAARAMNWRGVFGVHTWIATKPARAPYYTVHQVIGWRKWHNLPVVKSAPDVPDREWFGSPPQVVAELRGEAATRAIPLIAQAIADYPYQHDYVLWPGPNSNTFTAHVARKVPELNLVLPTTAIGKDFLTENMVAASAPSGTGFQLSLYGLIGVTLARREGIEFNFLGLSFGVDLLRPAIKLPGLGRLGWN